MVLATWIGEGDSIHLSREKNRTNVDCLYLMPERLIDLSKTERRRNGLEAVVNSEECECASLS